MHRASEIGDLYGIQRRIYWVLGLIVLLLMVLVGRLVYLQVHQHQQYETLSFENRIRLLPVAPLRGRILDRNRVELATNVPSYHLYVTPNRIEDMDRLIADLSTKITFSSADLRYFRNQLKKRPDFEPHILKAHLSDLEAAKLGLDQFRYPGVHVDAKSRRHYPYSNLTAHVVGYVAAIGPKEAKRIDAQRYRGIDYIGKLGLEQVYEDLLVGEPGLMQVETNAHGRTLQTLAVDQAAAGTILHLSLDIKLQQLAANLLRGNRGSVVAMEPHSGDILAMVSAPSYDPNRFVEHIDPELYRSWRESPEKPLLNRAMYGRYAPGSTIKPFLGLAALSEGIIDEETTFTCEGQYFLEGEERPFRCWKKEGHKKINLFSAISQSCDVFFYELGHLAGIKKMASWLTPFGFGRLTGVDFNNEVTGLVPTPQWKKRNRKEVWFPGETIISSIGQGYMLTTPLQLAFSVAQIANRGTIVPPRFLIATSAADGSNYRPVPLTEGVRNERISQQSYDYVIDAMRSVMSHPLGTARAAGAGLAYTMAGKTGTSQIVTMSLEEQEEDAPQLAPHLRDHALFIGFAPIINPKIALAVIVENGESGGKKAAPIARALMDFYLLPKSERRNARATRKHDPHES